MTFHEYLLIRVTVNTLIYLGILTLFRLFLKFFKNKK